MYKLNLETYKKEWEAGKCACIIVCYLITAKYTVNVKLNLPRIFI